LLRAQRESGLSEAAFCRRKKISKSSFSKAKQRHPRRRANRKPKAPAFVELSGPATGGHEAPATSFTAGEFELSLPGGIVLRWKA
jgi:hypothetical protein